MYATSSATFVHTYHHITRRVQLPACDDLNTDVCELVFKWLDEEDSHWLMVVDNADNADLLFSSAESKTGRGLRLSVSLMEKGQLLTLRFSMETMFHL